MRAIFVVLVFMFSLSGWAAESNPPTPSAVPNAGDKQTHTKRPNSASADNQTQPQAPPISIVVSPTIGAQEHGHANTSGSNEKTHEDRTLEILSIIITAIATTALAVVTWRLVHYTKKLWGATNDVVVEAKTSSEQQLRAYVFAGHDSPITLHKELFPSAQIDVKNFGQTPASEVICRATIGVYPYPLTSPLPPENAPNPSKSPLAPSQTIKQFPTLDKPLTKPHLDAILARQAAIYVWGEITYIDVTKTPRRTIFCLYCTGEDIDGGHLAYYPEGNDAT